MRSRPPRPDIVVDRPNGLLLVEVKQRIDDRNVNFFVDQLERYVDAGRRPKPAYSLLVDPSKMRFYRGTDSKALLVTLSTPQVLSQYDTRIGETAVFESYLATLVQAWLNDLALTGVDELPIEVKKLPKDLQEMLAA